MMGLFGEIAAWTPEAKLTGAIILVFNLVVFWLSLNSDPMEDEDGRI